MKDRLKEDMKSFKNWQFFNESNVMIPYSETMCSQMFCIINGFTYVNMFLVSSVFFSNIGLKETNDSLTRMLDKMLVKKEFNNYKFSNGNSVDLYYLSNHPYITEPEFYFYWLSMKAIKMISINPDSRFSTLISKTIVDKLVADIKVCKKPNINDYKNASIDELNHIKETIYYE